MRRLASTAVVNSTKEGFPLRKFVVGTTVLLVCFFLWFLSPYQSDPYIKATLSIQGSIDKGNNLFRMNCVGCHGISAQGLVGPDLHDVTTRLNDATIINQVAKGLTPPMPSFEIESESMADLIAYLHSIT